MAYLVIQFCRKYSPGNIAFTTIKHDALSRLRYFKISLYPQATFKQDSSKYIHLLFSSRHFFPKSQTSNSKTLKWLG